MSEQNNKWDFSILLCTYDERTQLLPFYNSTYFLYPLSLWGKLHFSFYVRVLHFVTFSSRRRLIFLIWHPNPASYSISWQASSSTFLPSSSTASSTRGHKSYSDIIRQLELSLSLPPFRRTRLRCVAEGSFLQQKMKSKSKSTDSRQARRSRFSEVIMKHNAQRAWVKGKPSALRSPRLRRFFFAWEAWQQRLFHKTYMSWTITRRTCIPSLFQNSVARFRFDVLTKVDSWDSLSHRRNPPFNLPRFFIRLKLLWSSGILGDRFSVPLPIYSAWHFVLKKFRVRSRNIFLSVISFSAHLLYLLRILSSHSSARICS